MAEKRDFERKCFPWEGRSESRDFLRRVATTFRFALQASSPHTGGLHRSSAAHSWRRLRSIGGSNTTRDRRTSRQRWGHG